mmetsp:Transcript_2277/g.7275  ORF Transcript_2277/g.7275 Transcript_2277/m.7275 type:complete len:82 (+) Transcript_2277:1778-2023(+)
MTSLWLEMWLEMWPMWLMWRWWWQQACGPAIGAMWVIFGPNGTVIFVHADCIVFFAFEIGDRLACMPAQNLVIVTAVRVDD